jgi:hypothetical protein
LHPELREAMTRQPFQKNVGANVKENVPEDVENDDK